MKTVTCLMIGSAMLLGGCDPVAATDAGADVPRADAPSLIDTPPLTDTPPLSDTPPLTDTPSLIDAPSLTDVPVVGGEPPVITMVAWTTPSTCVAASPSTYEVVVSVTDADTAAGSLTFTGSVAGCTGALNAATSTITCPNFAPYGGTVTVTDPEAHSDTQMFTIAPCTDGMVTP